MCVCVCVCVWKKTICISSFITRTLNYKSLFSSFMGVVYSLAVLWFVAPCVVLRRTLTYDLASQLPQRPSSLVVGVVVVVVVVVFS